MKKNAFDYRLEDTIKRKLRQWMCEDGIRTRSIIDYNSQSNQC